jgi:type IV pilus assembly protein PilB
MFVGHGFLTPEQLEETWRIHQESRQPFDQVLIELGFVGEREVLQAKAQGMGLPFVDLDRQPIAADAIASVPTAIARQLTAMPVKRQSQNLWVAMAEPNNIGSVDKLATASGCRVIPVVAVPDSIRRAIEVHYPIGS